MCLYFCYALGQFINLKLQLTFFVSLTTIGNKYCLQISVLENMSKLVASDLPSGVLHEDVDIYKETRKRAINVIIFK